jgi:hypothetical protein
MKSANTTASLLLGLMTLTLCTLLPACKKSNGAPPAMTATIGTTSFQSTAEINFHTVIDSIFAFNMLMRQSHDSSYIFLEFRGVFQLNVPIDSYTRPVLFEYTNFNSVYYSAGYLANIPNSPAIPYGHTVVTITAWDSTQHSIAGTFTGSAIGAAPTDSVAIGGKFNTTYTDN